MLTIGYMVTALFVMSIASRIKNKKFFETTLIGYILNYFYKNDKASNKENFTSILSFFDGEETPVTYVKKLLIIITLIEFLLFILLGLPTRLMILLVFYKLVSIPMIIKISNQWKDISDGIKRIVEGDLDTKISTENMNRMLKTDANNLNKVSEGIDKAVKEKMQSERMKTALITNVSHDIKIPLTSIINYVDLLSKELKNGKDFNKGNKESSKKVNEYINVLNRQSLRLKKLIEDLIEASKAQTGNIEVRLEDVNVKVLLEQAVGEFSDRLKEANLTLVTGETKSIIRADGRLLWRVYENIISNITKYSLPNSRVYIDYIDIEEKDKQIDVIFKNISKEKLNLSTDELLERFIVGDSSRNTNGSGLGLSISKSLTDIMGGKMNLFIDGDLFKVILTFPKA